MSFRVPTGSQWVPSGGAYFLQISGNCTVHFMKSTLKCEISIFLALDSAVLIEGERNRLQEELLGIFADTCGLETKDTNVQLDT